MSLTWVSRYIVEERGLSLLNLNLNRNRNLPLLPHELPEITIKIKTNTPLPPLPFLFLKRLASLPFCG